jgi:hypothetical protein
MWPAHRPEQAIHRLVWPCHRAAEPVHRIFGVSRGQLTDVRSQLGAGPGTTHRVGSIQRGFTLTCKRSARPARSVLHDPANMHADRLSYARSSALHDRSRGEHAND